MLTNSTQTNNLNNNSQPNKNNHELIINDKNFDSISIGSLEPFNTLTFDLKTEEVINGDRWKSFKKEIQKFPITTINFKLYFDNVGFDEDEDKFSDSAIRSLLEFLQDHKETVETIVWSYKLDNNSDEVFSELCETLEQCKKVRDIKFDCVVSLLENNHLLMIKPLLLKQQLEIFNLDNSSISNDVFDELLSILKARKHRLEHFGISHYSGDDKRKYFFDQDRFFNLLKAIEDKEILLSSLSIHVFFLRRKNINDEASNFMYPLKEHLKKVPLKSIYLTVWDDIDETEVFEALHCLTKNPSLESVTFSIAESTASRRIRDMQDHISLGYKIIKIASHVLSSKTCKSFNIKGPGIKEIHDPHNFTKREHEELGALDFAPTKQLIDATEMFLHDSESQNPRFIVPKELTAAFIGWYNNLHKLKKAKIENETGFQFFSNLNNKDDNPNNGNNNVSLQGNRF